VPRIDAQGIASACAGARRQYTAAAAAGSHDARGTEPAEHLHAMLLNALKESHEPPQGASDALEAKVTFDITASGAIFEPSNYQIVR